MTLGWLSLSGLENSTRKGALMVSTGQTGGFDPPDGDWRQRLALIVETMREMSRQTDPQAMVRAYGVRVRQLIPADRRLSLSRRDLAPPYFRITRSSTWEHEVNPWKDKDRLPLLKGGLLADLIYGDEPRLIDDLRVAADDPATEYLAGQRSLLAIPLYDQGVALNMVVQMRGEPGGFDPAQVPQTVWLSNLFGRAAHNLVLAEELRQAYSAVDREMKVVAEIQRSLLPAKLPQIFTLDLAASYQTASRAGGDYYDFFPLAEGRWGILIADVSGHGTPAAVLMAVTHAIAHTHPEISVPPGKMLAYVNRHLAARYTAQSETFVTAFYGIYDPARRELTYARAGHNPPRLKRCADRTLTALDGVNGLPLGISADETYRESRQPLQAGDELVFYTDGVTDARNPAGELFGLRRLDESLACGPATAREVLDAVLGVLGRFTAGRPADDDRTLLVARVS
jgi:sigma-B regulation protein RsbU (phosphoserine phosphatase)